MRVHCEGPQPDDASQELRSSRTQMAKRKCQRCEPGAAYPRTPRATAIALELAPPCDRRAQSVLAFVRHVRNANPRVCLTPGFVQLARAKPDCARTRRT